MSFATCMHINAQFQRNFIHNLFRFYLAGPGAHADREDQHDRHDGGDGPEHEAELESNSIDATLEHKVAR